MYRGFRLGLILEPRIIYQGRISRIFERVIERDSFPSIRLIGITCQGPPSKGERVLPNGNALVRRRTCYGPPELPFYMTLLTHLVSEPKELGVAFVHLQRNLEC